MIRPSHFILTEHHIAVPCEDLHTWATWMGDHDKRKVARTKVGPIIVSTVFLGLDYSFGHGDPILFETMTFVDDDAAGLGQWRWHTWDEAERGHADIVALVEIEAKVHPDIKGWAWNGSKEPKE